MEKEKNDVYQNTINDIRNNLHSSSKKSKKRKAQSQEKVNNETDKGKNRLFNQSKGNFENVSQLSNNKKKYNKKVDKYFDRIKPNFDFSYYKNEIKNKGDIKSMS